MDSLKTLDAAKILQIFLLALVCIAFGLFFESLKNIPSLIYIGAMFVCTMVDRKWPSDKSFLMLSIALTGAPFLFVSVELWARFSDSAPAIERGMRIAEMGTGFAIGFIIYIIAVWFGLRAVAKSPRGRKLFFAALALAALLATIVGILSRP